MLLIRQHHVVLTSVCMICFCEPPESNHMWGEMWLWWNRSQQSSVIIAHLSSSWSPAADDALKTQQPICSANICEKCDYIVFEIWIHCVVFMIGVLNRKFINKSFRCFSFLSLFHELWFLSKFSFNCPFNWTHISHFIPFCLCKVKWNGWSVCVHSVTFFNRRPLKNSLYCTVGEWRKLYKF